MIKVQPFGAEEVQHLQAAWCFGQGQILYKDFFAVCGPLWVFLISPIPKLFPDPVHALYAGRAFMAIFWIGMLILQWRLGASGISRGTRFLSVLFLASFSTFGHYTIETSPSVVAGFCVSVILVFGQGPLTPMRWIFLGLLTATTLFISPNVFFILGGYLAGLWIYRQNYSDFRSLGFFLGGIVFPVAGVIAYEWRGNALHDFLNCFILFNSRMDGTVAWHSFAAYGSSLIENPILWALALSGLFKGCRTSHGWALISAFGGIPFFERSLFMENSLLPLAPLICFYAAKACTAMVSSSSTGIVQKQARKGFFAAGLAMSLGFQAATIRHGPSVKATINEIRCVISMLAPRDAIMDTWSGCILFRPSPSYYSWIDPTLTDVRIEQIFLEALNRSECRGLMWNPIFMRKHPLVQHFAQAHYHYAGCNCLYLRN